MAFPFLSDVFSPGISWGFSLSLKYAASIVKIDQKGNVKNFSHFKKMQMARQSVKVVNFHSKCKILGGVTEFFGKAFLCRFPPENLPRPVVYPVHYLPIQVTLGDS